MNTFVATLAACLFAVGLMAQDEDPHVTGNVPITFYGKVVDQNNRAVAGVKVWLEYRVGYFTSPTSGKERWLPVSLTTDTNGNFILDGVKGGFVQFSSIEKDGYKLLPNSPLKKAGFSQSIYETGCTAHHGGY
jgi:protocatechuate 3,4-dioxygenase beta subunit